MTIANYKTASMILLLACTVLPAGAILAADDMGRYYSNARQGREKASATQNIKPTPKPGNEKPAKGGTEVFISLPTKIKPVKPEAQIIAETAKEPDGQDKALIKVKFSQTC